MYFLYARIRRKYGKSASRRLRAKNGLPAIIYGGNAAPIAIELDHNKIWNIQDNPEFYSEVLTIFINGKIKESVKIQNIQRYAYKPKLIHIDFIRI